MLNPILIDFIVQHAAGGRTEMANVLINFLIRLASVPF